MALPIEQQIQTMLAAAARPLILLRAHATGDSIAAAVALYRFLKAKGITATVVADGYTVPKAWRFLPDYDVIKSHLPTPRQLVITVGIDKTHISDFHYDVVDDQFRLYLTPKQLSFGPQDIKASLSDWHYDTIIVLDSPDLESLGEAYTAHREFFYERPIINIDHSPANEQFGQINLIDLTAASTAAVVYRLLSAWDDAAIDADTATCLLAGIIDATRSFKSGSINPQTLAASGQLMEKQARRDEIVKHLYYSRDVATLKLWGTVLTKLQESFGGRVVVAPVSQEDFTTTGTTLDQLPEIVDELIVTVPGVDVIVLIYQRPDQTCGVLIKSLGHFNPLTALAAFQPTGDRHFVKFSIPQRELSAAAELVMAPVREHYKLID